MARCCAIGLSLVLGAGCLWPPPLEELKADGGAANNPPRILWGQTTPALAQPFPLHQSQPGQIEPFTVSVVFEDLDSQVTTLRLFLGRTYNAVIAQETVTTYVKKGIVDIALNGLCDKRVNFEVGRKDLEVYISDSGFVDSGDDLRVINRGGARDNALWAIDCLPPK